ncbi:hypothetical protein NPX94_29225, partial [Bacillus wiedmannii]|uniref:ABC-three component system middle component 2 n=2 Tax=Bacillaceae TaxID=186817 RepID=UPI0034D95FEA|nr:hypothetical protein [Bacillus wiedmannii]
IDKHKEEMDFNEYYSYYHWHPDRDEYYLFLKYLLGKELINKRNTGNEFCYEINSRGKNVISKLSTNYAKKLNQSADYIRKELSKKSNKQIEEAILIYCLNKG